MKKRSTFTTIQTIPDFPNPNSIESVSCSISRDKIKFRRKRVNELRLRGYTNKEISNIIGSSLSTIEKDLHDIKELSLEWFEKQSLQDFVQSLQDSIIICDNAIEDLQILYEEHDDLDSKLKIISKIAEFEERKMRIYGKTNAVKELN